MPGSDLAERLPRHLKLRQLRVLLAVARAGSFSKAGSELHMTQPAVTAAIAELERTLGVPLFERSALGVTPTVHGESFIRRAVAIFGELRLAAQDIESAGQGARGALSVGVAGGLWGPGIMPAVLAELLDEHPQAAISIREAGEDLLIELVKAHDLDLAIGRLAPLPADPALALQPLFEDALRVVAGRSHPLARRRRVAWEEIAGECWVLPPPGTPTFAQMERTLRAAGVAVPRRVVSAGFAPVALATVLQGGFLALATDVLHESSVIKPLVSVVKVDLPRVTVPIGAITLRGRALPPLGLRLIELVGDIARAALRRRDARSGRAAIPVASRDPKRRGASRRRR